MNVDAKALGLTHTHYVEPTGISPGDRSTAYDQARLAADLMTSQAIVRSIVIKPVVVLPVAGALISYNPFVGTDGIVGVKSGYTVPAGGCEALALRFRLDGLTVTDYAVVLGQQGGELHRRRRRQGHRPAPGPAQVPVGRVVPARKTARVDRVQR